MDWIKRNLFFVIGAIVALALMGVAGWYNYSGWSQNSQARQDLEAKYEELKRLNSLNPNPGDGRKVDNIKRAGEQEMEVRQFIKGADDRFVTVPAIPPGGTNVTGEEFASALRLTIDQLQRDATNNSVILPPNFSYSFSVQRQLVRFSGGGEALSELAEQLGEVKVISDILHAAKINTLDSLRRERRTQDDRAGPQTDYVDLRAQTNDLAIRTPYMVEFRSFSPELALVLAGFAQSPYGLVVKTLNVEPATVSVMDTTLTPYASTVASTAPTIAYPATPYSPGYPANPYANRYPATPFAEAEGERSSAQAFRERYGGGRSAAEAFSERYGGKGAPLMRPPAYPQPQPQVRMVAPQARTGLQTVLNEKQLSVRMLVEVVKLLPPKK